MNREVVQYEKSASEGTHYLSGGGDVYEPSSDSGVDALRTAFSGTHILGGTSDPSSRYSKEDQRKRMLEAATSRLRREEEELEQSCGTSGPGKVQ